MMIATPKLLDEVLAEMHTPPRGKLYTTSILAHRALMSLMIIYGMNI